MPSLNSRKHLQDEAAAYAFVEAHLWPNGPECAHCGGVDKITKLQGKATRFGLYKCNDCRKQFRVTMGTIFEKSHVPLHLWLQAFYMMASGKKGVSSNELHRVLGVTLKTAWFMSHRVRESMRVGSLKPPMGSGGGVVEVDETIYGRSYSHPQGRARGRRQFNAIGKNVILSLVERGGEVRSYHVDASSISQVIPIVQENISREAQVMTDSANIYHGRLDDFASHDRVDHSQDEYVRHEDGRPVIHTNTVEGFFGVFKRGMRGTYQHCKEKHLHRYLAEFDFRYNNRKALGVEDEERAGRMIKGVKGKRLTYRTTSGTVPQADEPPFP